MSARLLGRADGAARLEYVLPESARIGSAEGADIRLVASGVAALHASIRLESGAHRWLVDESGGSGSGTLLNGRRISRESLRHLDVITIGGVDLIYLDT
jgi:pSer/pThr/pTyr-binding forkhead associated (FHA) protein